MQEPLQTKEKHKETIFFLNEKNPVNAYYIISKIYF